MLESILTLCNEIEKNTGLRVRSISVGLVLYNLISKEVTDLLHISLDYEKDEWGGEYFYAYGYQIKKNFSTSNIHFECESVRSFQERTGDM